MNKTATFHDQIGLSDQHSEDCAVQEQLVNVSHSLNIIFVDFQTERGGPTEPSRGLRRRLPAGREEQQEEEQRRRQLLQSLQGWPGSVLHFSITNP